MSTWSHFFKMLLQLRKEQKGLNEKLRKEQKRLNEKESPDKKGLRREEP